MHKQLQTIKHSLESKKNNTKQHLQAHSNDQPLQHNRFLWSSSKSELRRQTEPFFHP